MSATDYFVHHLADVSSRQIGKGTRIWQFVVVLVDAVIGENCNICANCLVENKVRIGNGVTIKSGVQLWDGVTIEDNVFIGPNVTFCNDKHPLSGNHDFVMLKTVVKRGASIGANATILPGITIGENAVIGAGSVVTKNVPPNQTFVGNPARELKK